VGGAALPSEVVTEDHGKSVKSTVASSRAFTSDVVLLHIAFFKANGCFGQKVRCCLLICLLICLK
jgi:hypothetical protein